VVVSCTLVAMVFMLSTQSTNATTKFTHTISHTHSHTLSHTISHLLSTHPITHTHTHTHTISHTNFPFCKTAVRIRSLHCCYTSARHTCKRAPYLTIVHTSLVACDAHLTHACPHTSPTRRQGLALSCGRSGSLLSELPTLSQADSVLDSMLVRVLWCSGENESSACDALRIMVAVGSVGSEAVEASARSSARSSEGESMRALNSTPVNSRSASVTSAALRAFPTTITADRPYVSCLFSS
jgi:hypothetical protein